MHIAYEGVSAHGNSGYIRTDHQSYGDYLYKQSFPKPLPPQTQRPGRLDVLHQKRPNSIKAKDWQEDQHDRLCCSGACWSVTCRSLERQTEGYLNENLPAKWFAGLAIDQKRRITPPEACIGSDYARKRSIRRDAGESWNCPQTRRTVWHDRIIDSVLIDNANTDKDDPDDLRIGCRMGVKHSYKVQTPEERRNKKAVLLGYKSWAWTRVSYDHRIGSQRRECLGQEALHQPGGDGPKQKGLPVKPMLPIGAMTMGTTILSGIKACVRLTLLKDNRLKKKDCNKRSDRRWSGRRDTSRETGAV